MPESDSTAGSAPAQTECFATTHWSVVLSAGDQDNPLAAAALEKLCRAYWYPLYAYLRRKGLGKAEAEDLTQAFFERLLQRDFPAGIRPAGGKFRSYLLTAMKRFLVSDWRARATQKRGGGQRVVSLEELQAENLYQLEPADPATPEELYERRWAAALLAETRQRLREEFTAAGKAELFGALEPCLTGSEEMLPYAELAGRLGLSESGVKMAVHRLRLRFGEVLRQEIAQTVSSATEVEEELRALISVLAR
ncbi:MAG: sigma-70 family RNA polymerase sigma factor [Verrucomicrobiales bacterium]|nr:sigma-70 family RNA polymerase sigma factor [Verrucomicrobiales bacterium]